MIFSFYIAFVTLAVLNVITGVFCEAAMEGAREDHELMCQQHLLEKHRFTAAIYKAFGVNKAPDEDATLAFDEFEYVLGQPKTKTFLGAMDLEVSDAWELFKLLDTDESSLIDVEEFVTGCLRLKGPAKAFDIAKLSYEQKAMQKALKILIKSVEIKLDEMLELGLSATNGQIRTSDF